MVNDYLMCGMIKCGFVGKAILGLLVQDWNYQGTTDIRRVSSWA